MKVEDLKVRNYILIAYAGAEGKEWRSSPVKIEDLIDISLNPNDYKPIEITQEWLEKFGFSDKEYKKGYIGIDVNNHSFVLQKPKFMGEWQTFYAFELPQFCFVKLEFVHQLQNLFYAIESEELTSS